jgi:xanthine/uracil permease
VISYATPNVVGVILMLIAFTLLPYLTRSMMGVGRDHPGGEYWAFLISVGLVLWMTGLSPWTSGFWKTLSLLLGMIVGTVVFAFLGFLNWQPVMTAPWVSAPQRWTSVLPSFHPPGLLAFAAAYLALLVNSLGSLHGIANITDINRLPVAMSRGIFLNGLGGVICGWLGIVGTVSYSLSPGVVLANRVASRFTITYCGLVLIAAAFAPKLSALLAVVPAPVVGAALCVAMGAQIGAGLSIIASAGITSRDYFVVGLPVLLGTMVGFLPETFLASMHGAFRVFLGNGLIVGIFLVLFLEHILLRVKIEEDGKVEIADGNNA